MVKTTVTKTKFSQLNGKRFCFPDGILSSSYPHQSLREIDEFNKQKGKKIVKYFWQEKEQLFQMEKKIALKGTPRPYLFHQSLTQHPKIVNINKKNGFELLNQPLSKKSQKILYSLEYG